MNEHNICHFNYLAVIIGNTGKRDLEVGTKVTVLWDEQLNIEIEGTKTGQTCYFNYLGCYRQHQKTRSRSKYKNREDNRNYYALNNTPFNKKQ